MTPETIQNLRRLAKASDEIWFEKEKLEHGEPYSDHVGRLPASTILNLLDEIELANRKLEKAKAALEKLSKQQTPEEYEDEFNEIPSDELLAEGYEYTVLAARAALAEIENQEGESK